MSPFWWGFRRGAAWAVLVTLGPCGVALTLLGIERNDWRVDLMGLVVLCVTANMAPLAWAVIKEPRPTWRNRP